MNQPQTTTVVKIGGNVIDNPEALAKFLTDFAALPGRKILVHGGGKEASKMSRRLGIEPKMTDGRRITDSATLEVVTMVYAGLINKRIAAMLQARGCNAAGLCGADGNAIRATRRKPEPIDFGHVGDISPDGVNHAFLNALIDAGVTPVICAITHDGNGGLLNCNADSVASAVACAASRLGEAELWYCFEKPGVLRDVDDPSSVISRIDRASYAALRADGIISDGMIPKIDNAFAAIDAGVSAVTIKHSDDLLDAAAGTRIVP